MFEELTPPYATIVADPPWPYDERVVAFDKTKPMPYSTMSVEDIAALPVADLAQRSSHLYLWTTNQFLWDARDVFEEWIRGVEAQRRRAWEQSANEVLG